MNVDLSKCRRKLHLIYVQISVGCKALLCDCNALLPCKVMTCSTGDTVLPKCLIIFLCSAINTFSGTDIGLWEKSGVKCLAQRVLGQSWYLMMTLQLVDNQLYLLSNRQPIEWQQIFNTTVLWERTGCFIQRTENAPSMPILKKSIKEQYDTMISHILMSPLCCVFGISST